MTDSALRAGYDAARRLNAAHGRTYYLATLLLPAAKRPSVHALYGFARYADDIVDAQLPTDQRTERFHEWSAQVHRDLDRGTSADPICLALIDTLRRWQIPIEYVGEFLDAMERDLTVAHYETHADLAGYMRGSAAVIGLQMLPILGRADADVDPGALSARAQELGIAFQLTNFLRDVGEDLHRGRIYLPQESLAQFGVDADQLARGKVTDQIRALLAAEIARTRTIYASAACGIELVHPSSRPCLRTAITLYGEILDSIERADYDVFSRRITVARARRAWVGGRGLLASWAARPPSQTHSDRVHSTSENPNSRSSTGA